MMRHKIKQEISSGEILNLRDRYSDRFICVNGFTIVELFIVVAMLGVVLAIVYNLFFYAQDGWSRSSAEARVLQDSRITKMEMEREIRQARVATINEAAITAVTESKLRIYSDIDRNNNPELIEYSLEQGSLWKRVWKASNNIYPYQYDQDDPPHSEKQVLSLVLNTDLFEVEIVDPNIENDPRRRVTINILVDDNRRSLPRPLELHTTVFSRTRIVD